jgi:hypothetical protein
LRRPRDTLYPKKLALTSPTSGGRSVCIVRLQAKATEFVCLYNCELQGSCSEMLQLSAIFSTWTGEILKHQYILTEKESIKEPINFVEEIAF